MSRETRFWRNVILIAITHTALLVAILRWSSGSKTANAQTITWLSGEAGESVEPAGVSASPAARALSAPAEETPQSKSAPEKIEENHLTPAVPKSDIQLPTETPTATATLAPKPTPRLSPRATPRITAKKPAKTKPSAKKSTPPSEKVDAAAGSSAAAKKKKTAEKKATGDKSNNSTGGGNSSHSGPAGNSSVEFNWYGNMLHDRFYREWAQPTTVVASGAKLSAVAKIRIEKDGRISDFKIVRSSGNVVVDESIESIAKRVTKVDALPAGFGHGDHYDVNINFELNPEQ
jgi:TonB family protein